MRLGYAAIQRDLIPERIKRISNALPMALGKVAQHNGPSGP
jgi:hypothetical protein